MRESLEAAMELAGYSFVSARDGHHALEMASSMSPDLMILDVMIPKVDGFGVARRLRSEGNPVPILMLTARGGLNDRVDGLDAGADDYLPKPFALQELLARARALIRRQHMGDSVLTACGLHIDVAARQVSRGEVALELTRIEYELAMFFVRNANIVLARATLHEAVWGVELEPGSKSLEVHLSTLRSKMEARGQARIIQTVRGIGYVLREAAT